MGPTSLFDVLAHVRAVQEAAQAKLDALFVQYRGLPLPSVAHAETALELNKAHGKVLALAEVAGYLEARLAKTVFDSETEGTCALCRELIRPGQAQVIQSNGPVSERADLQVAHLECFLAAGPPIRPPFKQRSFPGQPLSEAEALHANRIARSLEG